MSRIYGAYGWKQDTDTDNVSRKSSKLLVHIHNIFFSMYNDRKVRICIAYRWKNEKNTNIK